MKLDDFRRRKYFDDDRNIRFECVNEHNYGKEECGTEDESGTDDGGTDTEDEVGMEGAGIPMAQSTLMRGGGAGRYGR